ncbi:MAG: cyclase family protein [Clostridiales bacterium]|nr:cyclase family protein [Clostridiales bacterium]
MRIIDISMPISPGMPTYKERIEKRPTHSWASRMPQDSANESVYQLNLHTGTHLDAPLHMIEGGKTTQEGLPLERLMVQAKVFDLSHVDDKIGIQESDLAGLDIKEGDFILLKTSNSSHPRSGGVDYVSLKESGAKYLAGKKIIGVGIDALGIERDQAGHPTHRSLMEKDIIILEGLMLQDAAPGQYLLIALPLKIEGVEGAPARAVLIEGASLTKT